MRHEDKTVGSGLSARSQVETWLDGSTDVDLLRKALAPRNMVGPWPWNSRLIVSIRERREQYEVEAASRRKNEFGPDPEFVPRESEG